MCEDEYYVGRGIQIHKSQEGSEPLEKVNLVFDLADVFRNDWADSAWESLAECYGCLLAYIAAEDLEQLQRLPTEFATELGQLRDRVDNWEVRTDELSRWAEINAPQTRSGEKLSFPPSRESKDLRWGTKSAINYVHLLSSESSQLPN